MQTAAAQDCVYGSLGAETGSNEMRLAASHRLPCCQSATLSPFEIDAFHAFEAQCFAGDGLDRGSPDECRRILGSQSTEARGSGRTDSG
jgi:hypothetical protein